MRPRILMVNEASVLNTGYAVYGREVLKILHNSGKYEVAELACYLSADDIRNQEIPWKVFHNIPNKNESGFGDNPIDEFGNFSFNKVCLEFKPHIVFDIRDFWMHSYLGDSPFRKFYNLAILAPVDGIPQHEEWLNFYNSCDGIFTYSDWGQKVLKESCPTIKLVSAAPPVASKDFFPIPEKERQKLKYQLGLGEYSIIGTVMRNQRRKLFPELFKAFRQYLDISQNSKTLLYCHTAYPDLGWEIPKLLIQNGISNRVLFSYICNNEDCKHISPLFYSGQLANCAKCGSLSMTMPTTNLGVDNPILNFVYNMMDLYIQYSNSEGFGMPVLEAASAGVPVAGVNYTAMAENIAKLQGYSIRLHKLTCDVESSIQRAVPDDSDLVRVLIQHGLLSYEEKLAKRQLTRQLFDEKFGSWEVTAKKWMDYFDSVPLKQYDDMWKTPKRIHQPTNPENIPSCNTEFVNWLMSDVLGDKSMIGSYLAVRLLRDLNSNCTTIGSSDKYFSDQSLNGGGRFNRVKFTREMAYNHCAWLCNERNKWESLR